MALFHRITSNGLSAPPSNGSEGTPCTGVQVFSGAFALKDSVASIGVGHHLKLLVVFDEFVDQHFGIVVVYVVVTSAVDVQQVAFRFLHGLRVNHPGCPGGFPEQAI